jgi:hypothetical protein
MKKYIERTILFVLENLLTLMTIVFSFYIVMRSQVTTMSTDSLLFWIISLLGLLATSMLIERCVKLHKIEKHSEATYNYLIKMDGKPSFDSVMLDRTTQPSLESRLENVREIYMAGGSLVRLTSEYIGLLEKKAKEGCKMKFLLVGPDKEAVKLLAENVVYESNDSKSYSNQIKNSLSQLSRLQKQFPSKIGIKILEYVPPYSMLITNPNDSSSKIDIELYSYAVPARERVRMILTHLREPRSHRFFINQYERLWSDAIDYNLGS